MSAHTPNRSAVTIVNPGVQPELQRMAEGLFKLNQLHSYVTAFSVGQDWRLPAVADVVDEWLGRRAASTIERRRLAVPDYAIQRAGISTDLAFYVLNSNGRLPRITQRLVEHRNLKVQNAATKQHLRGTRLVVGRSTSAIRVFELARSASIQTLLDYPIAHHRWALDQLSIEMNEFPEFRHAIETEIDAIGKTDSLDYEISLADRLLTFNDFHSSTMVASGIDSTKLVVQPLGINRELFSPGSPHEPRDKFRILFVGQLTPRKGIGYALRAFQEANLKDSELIFVGRQAPGVVRYLTQDPRVRCIPHLPRNKLPGLYRNADLFLFPSLIEGFAQTPLEALACGLPSIISINAIGSQVLTGEYSRYLVDPRDVSGIAGRMREIREDFNLRTTLRRLGREASAMYDNSTISINLALKALNIIPPGEKISAIDVTVTQLSTPTPE